MITFISSIVFTIVMAVGAPYIASTLLTDSRAMLPILAISPIIPITAIAAVLRGYFKESKT